MSSEIISVIDVGIGNIGSVLNMLKVLGAKGKLVSKAEQLELADKIILPGVGSYDEGIRKIDESGIRPALDHKVKIEKKPILGICLGMQLLSRGSEEGVLPGLSYVDAHCKYLAQDSKVSVSIPHMRWNEVNVTKKTELFKGLDDRNKFYFTHSYGMVCANKSDILGQTNYGEGFVSAICKENIYGVQFHPEKSHKFGKTLFRNFLGI